jgi:hypothetical protein
LADAKATCRESPQAWNFNGSMTCREADGQVRSKASRQSTTIRPVP